MKSLFTLEKKGRINRPFLTLHFMELLSRGIFLFGHLSQG